MACGCGALDAAQRAFQALANTSFLTPLQELATEQRLTHNSETAPTPGHSPTTAPEILGWGCQIKYRAFNQM